jgi:hypothetical protein
VHVTLLQMGSHAPSRAAVDALGNRADGAPPRPVRRAMARVVPAARRSRTHARRVRSPFNAGMRTDFAAGNG